MPFYFKPLDTKDVLLIKPKVFDDQRGFFLKYLMLKNLRKEALPAQLYKLMTLRYIRMS